MRAPRFFHPVYPLSCPSSRRLLSFCIHLHGTAASSPKETAAGWKVSGVSRIYASSPHVYVLHKSAFVQGKHSGGWVPRVWMCVLCTLAPSRARARARVCDTIPRSWHVFIRQASIVSSYSKVKDRNWSVKADVIVSLFFRRAHVSAYARVLIAHTWGASILPVYRCVHHRRPELSIPRDITLIQTRFVLQYFAPMHVFRTRRSARQTVATYRRIRMWPTVGNTLASRRN